jgi:hypothetical protein
MAQQYPYRRVTNRPTLINPIDYPLTRTERQATSLKQGWEAVTSPTTLARTPPAGGALTSLIAGRRVAGSSNLRGGRV